MVRTQSRYDMMTAGSSVDPVDKQVYPDVLSVDYSSFYYYEPPIITQPDERMERKPYLFANTFYGTPYYEDIVLNINNVNHISHLSNATEIKFPVRTDLLTFMRKVARG